MWSGVQWGRVADLARRLLLAAVLAAPGCKSFRVVAGDGGVEGDAVPADAWPACEGVDVEAGTDLAALMEEFPAATRYCLRAGVHDFGEPILARSGDSFVGDEGAVVDGGGVTGQAFYGYGGDTGQMDVTVARLEIRNFTGEPVDGSSGGAIKVGDGWTIVDVEIHDNLGPGVNLGRATTLMRAHVHHNAQLGVVISPGLDLGAVITDCEISFNGSNGEDSTGVMLVGSTGGLTGVTLVDSHIHHNGAGGVFLNYNVGPDIEIARNVIELNDSGGIQIGSGWGADIHDNTVRDNASAAAVASCSSQPAQIGVSQSANVEIRGNQVSSDGANGICFSDAAGGDPPASTTTSGCVVEGNTVSMSGLAVSGLGGEEGPYDRAAARFDGNDYVVPVGTEGAVHWQFGGGGLDWSEWQTAAMQDSDGTLETE